MHRQSASVRYTRSGRVIPVSHCQQFQTKCAPTADDVVLVGLPSMKSCQGCEKFLEPVAGADWITCQFRGEPIGRVTLAGCNCDKLLYACSVHGTCFKRLPPGRTRESFGEQLEGVTICASECQDWNQELGDISI
ncbi:hypothetical protein [Schlesneria sp.]|uniref:hypothetical protein n=1 Tax=Schlesneria sp. TaxID=2762018 RepID=UPI002F186E9B